MYKSIIITIIIGLLISATGYSQTSDFDLVGKIESIREDNIITVIFKEKPAKDEYLIIADDNIIGNIKIITVNALTEKKTTAYRAIAEFFTKEHRIAVKAGYSIAQHKQDKQEIIYPAYATYRKESIYKQIKFSDIDNREMVLIPGGKFIFGSNSGEEDEAPEQTLKLDDFYIDKYEVSNSDYSIFVKRTNSKSPKSWISGKFNTGEDNFPVMVTYYEAVKYADWTQKRLPTEEEWEKAARGTGMQLLKDAGGYYLIIDKPIMYPWGNKFDALKTNSIEFWDSKNIAKEIKNKYKKGLLPVYMFNDIGKSPYGAVNMAGNASEWTSSWYNAYNGSRYSDKMYGTQVKVIRGGSWFGSKHKIRSTNREFGGIPNLYEDNIAGFRCVKDPTIIDKK